MKQMNLSDVLDLAISQEVSANRLYLDLANRAREAGARDALAFMAKEEARHRAILEAYKKGGATTGALGLQEPIDAHLVEAFGSPSWDPNWKPEQVYLMASKQEQVAHEFYQKLAQLHPEGETKTLLLRLAKEELGHKEKMEYLYANTAFPQTDGG